MTKGVNQMLQIYKEKKTHSKPPVSLLGQLLWREFYYAAAAHTPNYHQKEGNPICKQIDWDDNPEFFKVCPTCSSRSCCVCLLVQCLCPDTCGMLGIVAAVAVRT